MACIKLKLDKVYEFNSQEELDKALEGIDVNAVIANPSKYRVENGKLTEKQYITSKDKVVFGHPLIGKSFLKDSNDNRFISLDDDYAHEIENRRKDIIDFYKEQYAVENNGEELTKYQVQDSGGKREWHLEFKKMMQDVYETAKQTAINENKTLFLSNTELLKNNINDFDKVINIPDEVFINRVKTSRPNAKYDIREWKNQINKVFENIPKDKIITTTGYLSDLIENGKIVEIPKSVFDNSLNSLKQQGFIVEVKKDKYGKDDLHIKLPNSTEKEFVRVTQNQEENEFTLHKGSLLSMSKQDRIKLLKAQADAVPQNGKIINHGKSTIDGVRSRLNLEKHGWTVLRNQSHNQGFKDGATYEQIKQLADTYNLGEVLQNNTNEVIEGGIQPNDYYVKGVTLVRNGKIVENTQTVITNEDKIIWGHPAIGKTTMLESNPDAFIDWDDEFNRKRDKWIEDKSNTVKGTTEYKAARNEYMINYQNHSDYIQFVTEEWNKAKNKARQQNKKLLASPHMLLNLFPNDFDKIVNMPDEVFMERAIKRSNGDEVNSRLWKEGINESLRKVKDKSKIITTDKYIGELLPKQSQTQLTQEQERDYTFADIQWIKERHEYFKEQENINSPQYNQLRIESKSVSNLSDLWNTMDISSLPKATQEYVKIIRNLEILKNIPVYENPNFTKYGIPGWVQGRYNPAAHEIYVKSKTNPYILLHETNHALLMPGNYNQAFKDRIRSVIDYLKAEKDVSKHYAFSDSDPDVEFDEFLAEVMINESLQKDLAEIQIGGMDLQYTLWDKFVQSVKDFFKSVYNIEVTNSLLDIVFTNVTNEINDIERGTYEWKKEFINVRNYGKEVEQNNTIEKINKLTTNLTKVDTTTVIDDIEETGHSYTVGGKQVFGVTSLVKKLIEFYERSGDKRFGLAFNLENFKKNFINQRVSKNTGVKLTDIEKTKQAQEELELELKKFEQTAKFGTELHSINEAIFKNQEVIYKEGIFSNLNDFEKYVNAVKAVKKEYDDKGAIYLTETQVKANLDLTKNKDLIEFLKKENLSMSDVAGTIDLIAIYPDGTVDLLDFKTSLKKYEEWDNNKQKAVELQLELYKQILQTEGLNVNKVSVLPIKFDINNLNRLQDIAVNPVTVELPADSNVRREISSVVKNDVVQVNPSSPIASKIIGFMQKVFNYSKSNKETSISQDKINNFLDYNRKKKSWGTLYLNQNKEVIFHNSLTNSSMTWESYKKNKSDEDAAKEYLTAVYEQDKDIVSNVSKYFEAQREKYLKKTDVEIKYDKKDYNGDKKRRIDLVLSKYYTDTNWIMLNPDAEMLELNIIGFFNSKTNEVDYISVSDEVLDRDLELTHKGNVAGNYEKSFKNPTLLKDTVGNMLLMKTALFAQNSNRLPNSFKANMIQVLSINDTPVIQRTDILNKNLKYIFEKEKFDFKLSNSNKIDTVKRLAAFYENLISQGNNDKYKTIKDNLLKDEKEFLLKKQKQLELYYINNETGKKQDLEYYYVNEALLQMENIDLPVEEDISKFGHYITSGQRGSSETDAPNNMKNSILIKMKELVDSALNQIRYKFNDFVKQAEPVILKLYDNKQSKITRYTIGNLDIAFDNILELDSNGKPTMRLKKLTDKDLSKEEKDFIRLFMDTINDIRESRLQEGIDLTEEQRREIPLVKATTFNRIKNSTKNIETVKQAVKEDFNDMFNVDNLFNEEKKERIKNRNEYSSQFRYQEAGNNREDMLVKNNIDNFEKNLELVLYYYQMSNLKEKEFSKILPAVNAMKGLVYVAEKRLFVNMPNVYENMKSYIDAIVFGTVEESFEEERVRKVLEVPKKITALFAIGFSPMTAITQGLMGIISSYSAVFAREGVDIKDLAKANTIVLGDTRIEAINRTEQLNNLYGVISMDVDLLVKNRANTDTGLRAFFSRFAHWMSYIPDYYNRMSLFTAQMLKDGNYDAHTIVDGMMVYDEALDKRFFTNGKFDSKHPRLLFMKQEMKKEEGLNDNGTLKRAYTWKESRSIKEMGNRIHGNYSKEDRIKYSRSVWGAVMMQFKAWVRAKLDQYYLTYRESDAVGNYQYIYQQDENGEYVLDKDSNKQLLLDENGYPQMLWTKSPYEGFMNTLFFMYQSMRDEGNWNPIQGFNNMEQWRKDNVKHFATDATIIALLYALSQAIDDDDKRTKRWEDQVAYIMYKTSKDMFVFNTINSIAGTSTPYVSIGYSIDLLKDLWSIPDKGFKPFLTDTGVGRLYYNFQ